MGNRTAPDPRRQRLRGLMDASEPQKPRGENGLQQPSRVELLYDIVHACLDGPRELEPRLVAALRAMQKIGITRGTVLLVDPPSGELIARAAVGVTREQQRLGRYAPGEGVVGETFSSGKPRIVRTIDAEERFLNRMGGRSEDEKKNVAFISVPITPSGRETVGVLAGDCTIESADTEQDNYDAAYEERLQFLTVVAAILGDVVRQWREHRAHIARLVDDKLPISTAEPLNRIVGSSHAIVEVKRMVETVATSRANVLLRGESGTGKGLVCKAIHELSGRGKLVTVNCGAIPESLIESELFGHVAGAFTGAMTNRDGKFQLAHGGTIFLDEIAELSAEAQACLLRVLQEREVQRVGASTIEEVDVRVIAATHQNLEERVADGLFREDLYYRLTVFPIMVPPLRKRPSDIPALIDHSIARLRERQGSEVKRVSSQAIDILVQYHWPGNVRELENCIERAALLSNDGTIRANHLPPTLQTGMSSNTLAAASLSDQLEGFERELLIEAMKEGGGVIRTAAELLNTTPRIVSYRLKKLGLHHELVRARRDD